MVNVINKVVKMNPIKSNRLLQITLISYLLTFLSAEKWDVPMILALPISCIGIYDFLTLLSPLSGFMGIGIILYFLINKKVQTMCRNWLLFTGLFLLWGPIIAFQDKKALQFEWQHGIYLFIPELVFVICFIIITIKTVGKITSRYPLKNLSEN